ncbi:hypothetical protein B0T14DRAFT_454409 [Immersiella caudata]|uniref:Uncharacterized protein n=1 Tax=Immersiella caudata TaxID=314043 RepID=A0AA39WZH7_9PEZI|nr:hypothetical protein B0T14DRAFT_454409 [Immersiella caudata]
MAPPQIGHHDMEQISLASPTFDQIVQCIVDARSRDAKCFVTFDWPEEQLDDLQSRLSDRLYQLDIIAPQRLEYDFQSKTVHLDMAETKLHTLFAIFSALLTYFTIGCLVPSVQDAAIRLRLKAVINFGTSQLELKGKLSKQADWAFGCVTTHLPTLVCEVSFGQSWENAKAKVLQYIKSSDGKIKAAIILDIKYPEANLLQLAETLYDHNADEQPAGHISLYVSDVIGLADLPLSYCRPSTAERDAGVLREPQITLTYDQLRDAFLKALAVH